MLKLKKIMRQKGMTIKELAQKTGLSERYINQLRNEEAVNPTLSVLKDISQALGIHPRELL